MSTFNETYFEFDAEVERIEDEIESLGEEIDGLENGGGRGAVLTQQLQQLQTERKGAIWARDRAYENDDFPQWDEDVDGVVLAGVTGGAYDQVDTDIRNDPDAGEGAAKTLLIAEGSVADPEADVDTAPYVSASMSDRQAAAAVSNLHPFYKEWANSRVNGLMDPESGNVTSSGTSPGGKRAETTPTDE